MKRRGWVAHAGVAAAAGASWAWAESGAGRAFFGAIDLHNDAKVLIGTWHTFLFRVERLPVAWAVAAVLLTLGRRLPLAARIGLALGVAATPGASPVARAVAVAWAAANLLLPDRPWAWVPGVAWVLPGPTLPAWARPFAVFPLVFAWTLLDSVTQLQAFGPSVLAWTRDLGPAVHVIARAPAGVECEYHDLDLLPDRYVVVQEGTHQLVARARDDDRVLSVEQLPPFWGPMRGVVLDSDSAGPYTWYLRIPNQLVELRWGPGFQRGQVSQFGSTFIHAYLRHVPELGRVVAYEVGVQADQPGHLVSAAVPGLTDVRTIQLRTPDGGPGPQPRDLEWIPPLHQFALAPDMRRQLWLSDPVTGLTRPWLDAPATDGKLAWVDALQRLFVAIPTQPLLWIVTAEGTVERKLPTQPGARAVAVDTVHGLVLTASVLTGELWVQRLEDAAIVHRFGPFMPMVRELRLDPATGQAWLTTWTVLYRIDYL